ncbi:ABC transporter ATP-binding protein [Paenibacillus amylolyticus]|uniref:ABC transporter ATP-binding protein n=1 Tax=Paenibacillus amylolyticus TaxID=1451 RepID=UPI003D27286A
MIALQRITARRRHMASSVLFGLSLLWTCSPVKVCTVFAIKVLEALLGPLLVWLSAKIIDRLAEQPFVLASWDALAWMVLLYIGLTLVVDALQPVSEMHKRLLTAKLQAHIDELLISKAMSIPDIAPFEKAGFHTKTRVIQYNEYFVTMWLTIISQTIGGLVVIAAGSIMIGTIAPWAPIVLLALVVPKLYWEAKLNNATFEGREEVQELRRRAEYYAGTPLRPETAGELKVFGLVPFFKERYLNTSRELLLTLSADQRKLALHQLLWSVLQSLAAGLIIIYLVGHALSGHFTAGDIFLFIGATIQLNEGMNELFAAFAIGPREARHLEKIRSFLYSENEMESGPCPPAVSVKEGFRLEGVRFRYDETKIVLDIPELIIPAGKVTVLVGENGSGKSTLVKLLLRFFDPNEGVVFYNGIPLCEYDIAAYRTQATAVFQDFVRYEMNLRDNIGLGNLAAVNEQRIIERAAKLGGVDEFIHKLGQKYDTQLGRLFGGRSLSGGEWQRIALSRAFMRKDIAGLLIMDEPSSALDVFMEEDVFQRMRDLMKNKTVVIVSHRLSTARHADYVVYMEQGRIMETGTHNQLLVNGVGYAELYNMQAQKYR